LNFFIIIYKNVASCKNQNEYRKHTYNYWKDKNTYKKIWKDMVVNPDKPYAVVSMNTTPMKIVKKIDQTEPYIIRDFSKYYLYKLNAESLNEIKKIKKFPYTGFIVNHNNTLLAPDYLDLL